MLLPFPTSAAPSPAVRAAVAELASQPEVERGAIYTRPEVVHAILDLVGYTDDQPLHARRLLEPSFGAGSFLLPAIDRLIAAWRRFGSAPKAPKLARAIRAVELHEETFAATRRAVVLRLVALEVDVHDAELLADAWLVRGDFLLAGLEGEFDVVVGNPPYVRQERIPEALLLEYRRRYKTVYDRADLYVPFYERGLDLLRDGGKLGYICANRWVKNKYGGPLREKIATGFHLAHYINMEGTNAFESEVIAYPSITVIERGTGTTTRTARRPDVTHASMGKLVRAMLNGGPKSDARVEEVEGAVTASDPWLLDEADQLRVLRDLEARFPTVEESGCRVGIGVATGIDRVYIGAYDDLPVEPSRKVPLVMAGDLRGGTLTWHGKGVLNPFEPDGSLADLARYPRFAAFIEQHREAIAARHCANKAGGGWYRTIDRIWPELTTRPKLLIPDIKGEPTVVVDRGQFYPHHNLYWVTSDVWDLDALATVLRSSVAVLLVSAYCVRMAGGFLRFQAQYLRRIRVPRWESMAPSDRQALREAPPTDLAAVDRAVFRAFGLSPADQAIVTRAATEARVLRRTP